MLICPKLLLLVTMLKLQQCLVLALAVCVLALCFSADPALGKKSKSSKGRKSRKSDNIAAEVAFSSGSSGSSDSDDSDDSDASVAMASCDVVAITNFLVEGYCNFTVGLLGAFGSCVPLCADAVTCIGCFALTIPQPPVFPPTLLCSAS